MKKIIATFTLAIFGLVTFSQNMNAPHLLKYVTHSPDGSIAMTITDDTSEDSMKVESADAFYKYQILDQKTSESVYMSQNEGKECVIDKTKLAEGTYDLRLYTSDFVITTDIEILRLGEFNAMLKNSNSVAFNE